MPQEGVLGLSVSDCWLLGLSFPICQWRKWTLSSVYLVRRGVGCQCWKGAVSLGWGPEVPRCPDWAPPVSCLGAGQYPLLLWAYQSEEVLNECPVHRVRQQAWSGLQETWFQPQLWV